MSSSTKSRVESDLGGGGRGILRGDRTTSTKRATASWSMPISSLSSIFHSPPSLSSHTPWLAINTLMISCKISGEACTRSAMFADVHLWARLPFPWPRGTTIFLSQIENALEVPKGKQGEHVSSELS